MRFEFATATRIVFGAGAIRDVAPLAAELGSKALVVVGRSADRAGALLDGLKQCGVSHELYSIDGEPGIDTALEGVRAARRAESQVVLGFGGGSVLDTGKAIAALLANGGEPLDYLEGIGRGKPIAKPSAPYIAVPTTAGTGAEVTRNAVLGSPEHRVKASMRSPFMLPRLAVVDPELTHSMPPSVTAATGLDALTQLVEAFVSSKANPLTDGLCREGIPRAARSLKKAFHDGQDAAAREDMALASLFSGLALANAGLGAVHGIAGPFGGLYGAPHGAVCARLLPYVMAANVNALLARSPASPALERHNTVARLLTGNQHAQAQDGVDWATALCGELHVPPLATYGLTASAFGEVAEKSRRASSMKGNPIDLTDEELTEVLEMAL